MKTNCLLATRAAGDVLYVLALGSACPACAELEGGQHQPGLQGQVSPAKPLPRAARLSQHPLQGKEIRVSPECKALSGSEASHSS